MPPRRAKSPPESRYSYDRITEEIQSAIERTKRERPGFTQKDVASYCNLTEQQFSHRMSGIRVWFKVEDLGAIADFLRAPPGWPFVVSSPAAVRPPPKAIPRARRT